MSGEKGREPMERGPMTGRGAGHSRRGRHGYGRPAGGRGQSRGRGWRQKNLAPENSRRRRMSGDPSVPATNSKGNRESDLSALELQAERLQQALEDVQQRIASYSRRRKAD